MPLITAAQLARVAPHAAAPIVAAIVDHADTVLPCYGLTTTARLPHFLAHVLVESAYLSRVEENLNYTAERLHAVWPSRFPTVASAAPYAHNPRALANKVYGGRMANKGPDDGWLNRGQGLIQTTGHDNIARLAAHLKISFEAARAMLTSPEGMLEAAAATYVLLGCPTHADRDDIVAETRALNGGTNGLEDRRRMLALCKRVWPRVVAPAVLRLAPSPAVASPAAVPPIPSQTKEPAPMSRLPLFALVMGLFGLSIGSAQAATVDVSPLATMAIDYVLVPVLLTLVPTVAALLVMPLRRFLDQRSGDLLASRVNDVLDKAIAFAAQQGAGWLQRSDFHLNVDGWLQEVAAGYAVRHAPDLLQKVGATLTDKVDDLLSQKIAARLPSHPDVLALKGAAAVVDAGPVEAAKAA